MKSPMRQLKIAVVVAAFGGMVVSYGVYRWLKHDRELGMLPEGVSCYTGTFPSLHPVSLDR